MAAFFIAGVFSAMYPSGGVFNRYPTGGAFSAAEGVLWRYIRVAADSLDSRGVQSAIYPTGVAFLHSRGVLTAMYPSGGIFHRYPTGGAFS